MPMKASFAWRALVDVRPVAHRDGGLFPGRDFLSSRWDKLSHLFEHSYLLKSWAHLGFGWICCYSNYSGMMARGGGGVSNEL